jgi:hypothetical protein
MHVIEMAEEIDTFHFLQLLELVVSKLLWDIRSLRFFFDETIPVESFEEVALLDLFKRKL